MPFQTVNKVPNRQKQKKTGFFPLWRIGKKTRCGSPNKSEKCFCATLLPYCANAALPYPMYAYVRRLLVFVPFLTVWHRVKKFFDTLKRASHFEMPFSFWSLHDYTLWVSLPMISRISLQTSRSCWARRRNT